MRLYTIIKKLCNCGDQIKNFIVIYSIMNKKYIVKPLNIAALSCGSAKRYAVLPLIALTLLLTSAGFHQIRANVSSLKARLSANRLTDTSGLLTKTMNSGRWERIYYVHLPVNYNPNKKYPVVLFFHGAGGTGSQAAHDYHWIEASDKHDFILVAPQGLPSAPRLPGNLRTNPNIWRDGREEIKPRNVDDVAFVNQLIDKIETDYSVDPKRIYSSGFSNGAGMTFHLGIHMSNRLAAIAPVSSHIPDQSFTLERPLSMIFIIGSADPLNPYNGGTVTSPWGHSTWTRPAASETIKTWCDAIGCPETPRKDVTSNGVRYQEFGPGHDNSEVAFYTIDGMGHHWSGSRERLSKKLIGDVLNPINATEVVWQFLSKHRGNTP